MRVDGPWIASLLALRATRRDVVHGRHLWLAGVKRCSLRIDKLRDRLGFHGLLAGDH
jgi:hypothetical protein